MNPVRHAMELLQKIVILAMKVLIDICVYLKTINIVPALKDIKIMGVQRNANQNLAIILGFIF